MTKNITFQTCLLAKQGEYSCQATTDELYEAILQDFDNLTDEEQLIDMQQKQAKERKLAGLAGYYRNQDLAEVHWRAIIPEPPYSALEEEHLAALERLEAHRQAQMQHSGKALRETYRQGESYLQLLTRCHVVPGQVEPDLLPYYLCIVGSPERIPWEYQQYLDSDYAVGRIWFDEPGDVDRYVSRLIAEEPLPGQPMSDPGWGKWVLFSAVQHDGDPSTQNSSCHLTMPLQGFFSSRQSHLGFTNQILLGNTPGCEARKSNFKKMMAGNGDAPKKPPAIFFSSSHGYETDELGDDQEKLQGAPLFQEFGGPFHPMQPEHCLTGSEAVQDQLPVTGSFGVAYACFSAGTPLKQDWVVSSLFNKPREIARRPFVARLPQKLMALGMLGFIGHVSRTSRFAFQGTELHDEEHIEPFKDLLCGLAVGDRAGHTTRLLNEGWVALNLLLDPEKRKELDKEALINTWLTRNDLRGYVLLGDPAARLKL